MGILLHSAFSKTNAETDAKFISYRELLEKLSSESGDSLHDVALFLKRKGAYKNHAIWLSGPERTAVWDEHGVFVGMLLDQTIIENQIAGCTNEYGYEVSDPDTHGWWRQEFLWSLSVDFGLLTPPSLDSPSSEPMATALANGASEDAILKLQRSQQDLADIKSQNESLKLQLGDAQKTIDDLRRLVGDQSGIALHNTHLMKIALEVQRTYWRTLDRTRNKQETIVVELMKKYGLTRPEAQAVERVACPIDRK